MKLVQSAESRRIFGQVFDVNKKLATLSREFTRTNNLLILTAVKKDEELGDLVDE